MQLLLLLLVLNAGLHAFLVYRFGVKGNEPFAAFTLVYAALALAVALTVPYALWVTLALAAFGLAGLTVTFGRADRDNTLDRIIWAADAAVVLCAAALLFL